VKLTQLATPIRPLSAAADEAGVSGLPRITQLPAEPPVTLPTVAIPMTAAERRRVRRRIVTPDGLELGLALPTGTVLEPGTLLFVAAAQAYRVEASPEEVVVMHHLSTAQMVAVAHAIGNLHRDLVMAADGLVALWDAPLELMLLRMNIPFSRQSRPFCGRPSWEH
jgi:urease accessory protein